MVRSNALFVRHRKTHSFLQLLVQLDLVVQSNWKNKNEISRCNKNVEWPQHCGLQIGRNRYPTGMRDAAETWRDNPLRVPKG